MPTFNVFYEWQGSRITVPIGAGSPQEAAAKIRKQAPGAVILKVKVDKSGNVSPRAKLASIDDIVNGRAKLGINPNVEIRYMTAEEHAELEKLDWVPVGDARVRPGHR